MTRPTHVMVASPIDCKRCNGTGLVQHSFMMGPNGPVCPDCKGAKMAQTLITLEEFAALFRTMSAYSPSGILAVKPAPNEGNTP